jgi:hypothetical protein
MAFSHSNGKISKKPRRCLHMSLSDWISFLTSEKNANIGIIVGFSAFMLAAFAVIISITNNTLLSGIITALISVALVIIYFRTIGPFGRRAKVARELLDAINARGREGPISNSGKME